MLKSLFSNTGSRTYIKNKMMVEKMKQLYTELKKDKYVKSRTDMAKKLGISKTHCNDLINGKFHLTSKIKKRIVEIFGVQECWFEDDSKEMYEVHED